MVTVLKTDKLKGSKGTSTDIVDFDFYFSHAKALEQMPYIDTVILTLTEKVTVEHNRENISITVVGVNFTKYREVYPTQFKAEYGKISTDPASGEFVIGYNV